MECPEGALCLSRVPLIAGSWYPGWEEVETQGGNGRKWESEREGERESVEKCCFCLPNILKEPEKCKKCICSLKSLVYGIYRDYQNVEHTP